ncbi:hypothetical protein ABG067_009355 [Albugo candida]
MDLILRPLNGRPAVNKFLGPDHHIYSCVTSLATYSADYPEQCMIAGIKSWLGGYGCPRCYAKKENFRDVNESDS